MGYHQPTTRTKEYRQGNTGRRRTYKCRECGIKFHIETHSPLPDIDRVCGYCISITVIFTFTNKHTGREKLVRAPNAELATLRAWAIDPDLTFKIPQEASNGI